MPPLSVILLTSLLALNALARPAAEPSKRHNRHRRDCLSPSSAQEIATNYGLLISNYTDTLANQLLAPNFIDYSESVNTLINSCPQGSAAMPLPLLAPTFSNRSAFETGQAQQPQINFNQLNLWYTCDTVIIRWETTNTANITDVKPVVGLISMETVSAPEGEGLCGRWIDTVYSEFDAGAWLQNLQEAGICSGSGSEPVPDPTVDGGAAAQAAPVAATMTPTVSAARDFA
ncbi:hypothetical protein B0A50_03696 [Salinomyces thailandicus]|uniref:NTF2-like domain-containing protein n=1 Tax=Salinomyces thailandicus TaxID=706561 RepID=A0A4U0U425_9PEZI|nr:hypothetical protein B0A50_03696 [Salinomyces thailandica]